VRALRGASGRGQSEAPDPCAARGASDKEAETLLPADKRPGPFRSV
jgi:hypothetical protein